MERLLDRSCPDPVVLANQERMSKAAERLWAGNVDMLFLGSVTRAIQQDYSEGERMWLEQSKFDDFIRGLLYCFDAVATGTIQVPETNDIISRLNFIIHWLFNHQKDEMAVWTRRHLPQVFQSLLKALAIHHDEHSALRSSLISTITDLVNHNNIKEHHYLLHYLLDDTVSAVSELGGFRGHPANIDPEAVRLVERQQEHRLGVLFMILKRMETWATEYPGTFTIAQEDFNLATKITKAYIATPEIGTEQMKAAAFHLAALLHFCSPSMEIKSLEDEQAWNEKFVDEISQRRPCAKETLIYYLEREKRARLRKFRGRINQSSTWTDDWGSQPELSQTKAQST